jgi:hypothetical protein
MTVRNDKGAAVVRVLALLGLAAVVAAAVIVLRIRQRAEIPIVLRGAVIKQSADTRDESPIANADISAADGLSGTVKSDFAGAFRITLRKGVLPGQPITLLFRHPDYAPLDAKENVTDQLYVVKLAPLHGPVEVDSGQPGTVIGNIMVRYSTGITSTENIRSAVKTFQAINTGNVPCDKQQQQQPCSPDGKWKAVLASASLDAGEGNVFADARVTCIAGPCPFTAIQSDGFSRGGRSIKVSILNWSDTTTFLLQAEVYRPTIGNTTRQSYPVIFGQAMNFTLPNTAEGPSIEAELNGTRIVFPLGPAPMLSWADCNVRVERNQAKDYRCELKPGFKFK